MSMYEQLPENSYIKKLLVGVDSEVVENFLTNKKNYESSKDKEEKRLLRDKLTNLFWELYKHIAVMINPELSMAKKMFLRYGLVDLRNLSPEDQKFILNQENETIDYDSESIFYLDEWLLGISTGKIKASAGDETQKPTQKSGTPAQSNVKSEKYASLLDVETKRFESFKKERADILNKLKKIIDTLEVEHKDPLTGYMGIFSPEQTSQSEEITFCHKELRRLNKEIVNASKAMKKAQESLDEINAEIGLNDSSSPDYNPNKENILSEVINIRQMAKMTVGRQGNSFPILTSGFMPKETKDYLFRNIVRKKLNHWLEIDPEAFYRTYKGENMNITPYMILIPGYGITGSCWEPLDANNKQFGKGRIVLPIFTRSPDLSLLTAIGDIRWQSAKEIASYYWMEEGLTGRYYEYYLGAKLKGDLRTLFITDYLLWMTKETQGVQKLEQDARYVFWRYVPLPEEQKIKLSNKGYYYSQLWEKEQVWRKNKNA